MARITPARIPGTAEGSTTLKTVRSLPAPRPKLASRKESGTDLRASSVVRMMSGRIMIASVHAPERSEKPQCSAVTKKSIPKSP